MLVVGCGKLLSFVCKNRHNFSHCWDVLSFTFPSALAPLQLWIRQTIRAGWWQSMQTFYFPSPLQCQGNSYSLELISLFHAHVVSMELEEDDAKKIERDACSKNHWFHFLMGEMSIRLMWPPVRFIIVINTTHCNDCLGGSMWLKTC